MNINATMLGQAISFVIFAWLCMKYVWPPLVKLLDERRAEIAEGLAQKDKAAKELELAKANGATVIAEAREKAQAIIAQGQQRQDQLVAEAVELARQEKDRIIAEGKAEIDNERNRLRQELKAEMADLVIESASKLISRNLDSTANRDLVNRFISEM
ncbi:F0F1 ATP synthase subunit B [Vibrio sp. Vb2880]|uniref:ATP synthase subunit b n=1 Tax=Vibrio furnissii TaxID=29494 RepID=A0A0Q2V5D0_VIBFU|nr:MULTISPECIES: F0F1 ATP synthase subunit B [Vibrio]KQH87992.1 ATP synthase subunit B [Vibrio furnissii]MBO0213634.1 F0F1 ATP synthase subunit B [Vibrio sp. Vb2880]MCG6210565.1 F0F1 ATP synthase subunit B [Vibrio furnissii]MCG6217218.1 F0F1 ATP synthase subunit B [Vibrio furnissii]MCG6228941.1 F0F1 ATP synthase subunit B [Vibrio furnissii]